MKSLIIPLGLSVATATAADDVELAMKLSNPIADLISAPIQSNYDFGIGAGDGTRWTTNIQPVLAYTLPTATTLTLNLESTYDWRDSQWTVPVNFQVSQLVKFGSQPVQLFAGIRAYPEAPDDGPEWGVRFGMTFLFPKS
jgi:hypothetical protein